MKFHVENLGCKVNRVESDMCEEVLAAQGGMSVSEQEADIVVINTCAVTSTAEKKTRKAVRQALRANENSHILVTGCAANKAPEIYEAMSRRVQVVQKWDLKDSLAGLAEESAPGLSAPGCDRSASDGVLDAPKLPEKKAALKTPRARMGIKVQDGCANACTYCIVHTLRGPEMSTPLPEVLQSAKELCARGVSEITLTGINLGRYEWRGSGLDALLTELLALDLPARFRLSSIEPADVSSSLVDVLAKADGRVCRHLHIPLQSGSTKVLREMERGYTRQDFAELVSAMRSRIACLSVTTDVIVGFPGETESDFADTLSLCRACAFSKMHVFPYSEREGTPAASRTDQVPRDVRIARAAQTRTLAQELRRRDLLQRSGTREIAVVETPQDAMSESYHWVCPPEGSAVGSLVEVML